MQNLQPKEKVDHSNSNHKPPIPHLQVINKTKSAFDQSNLHMNFTNLTPGSHKKENTISTTPLSPQKKKSPLIYNVCKGDTIKSIASKFNISENWLVRQNMKQIIEKNFILSEGSQVNVTSPSQNMIKPLNCSLVRGASHSDSEESLFDDEIGENGIAYIIICENSFDFVPKNFGIHHKPIHIKLTSINDDVIIFTPKSQRDKIQKQKSQQSNMLQETKLTDNIPDKNNGQILKTEDSLKEITALNRPDEMTIERLEETSNKNEKVTQQMEIQEYDDTSIQPQNLTEISNELTMFTDTSGQTSQIQNVDESKNSVNATSITQPPNHDETLSLSKSIIQDQDEPLRKANLPAQQQNQNENKCHETQKADHPTKDKLDQILADQQNQNQNNAKSEEKDNEVDVSLQEEEIYQSDSLLVPSYTDGNTQKATPVTEDAALKSCNERDSALVITFIQNQKDPDSVHSLYFRVSKEEGNSFSASLQKAIKEAKIRAKARKPNNKGVMPQSLPSHPPSISGSPSSPNSPFGFFQSIFNSIKDSFSHLNDNTNESTTSAATTNDDTTQRKQNLYRRSFSGKSFNNTFGLQGLDLGSNKDDQSNKEEAVKPRRNSEMGSTPSTQQKRKALAGSVLLDIKIIDGPSTIFERREEIDEIRTKLPYRMRSYDWMLIYRLSRDGSSSTNFFNYTRNSGPIVFIMSTSTNDRIGAFIPTGFKYSSRYYGSGECFVFRMVKEKEKEKVNDKEEKNENDNSNNNNNEKEETTEKVEDDTNTNTNTNVNNEKEETTEKVEVKEKKDETPSFARVEVFRWTSGTNSNFMMSEKDTIIIGIGDDKDFYNQDDIDAINSSNGFMSGPAIWIGEDFQYASSSRCSTFRSPQLTEKNYFSVIDIEIWKIGYFSNK